MPADRLWATWRSQYVSGAADRERERVDASTEEDDDHVDGVQRCVFCQILDADLPDEDSLIIWRGPRSFAILNRYPYVSGHSLVMPYRHVADLGDLEPDEAADLWQTMLKLEAAIQAAYRPQGINLGANLGPAAGAGIPGHLHLHALPRWMGDTNFLTSIAETRVMPEALDVSLSKLQQAWPGS